jgi:hypothetical protein
LRSPQDVVETLAPILYNQYYDENAAADDPEGQLFNIKIIKNNDGQFYWPEMGTFNQIGDFIPGQGYLLKMNNPIPSYYFPIIE